MLISWIFSVRYHSRKSYAWAWKPFSLFSPLWPSAERKFHNMYNVICSPRLITVHGIFLTIAIFQGFVEWQIFHMQDCLYHHYRQHLICLHIVHPYYKYKNLTHLFLFCFLGNCLNVSLWDHNMDHQDLNWSGWSTFLIIAFLDSVACRRTFNRFDRKWRLDSS